jgi:branched-chain amino acid transport system permease protein
VLLTLWSGLALGAVYATVALGFTMSMLPSGVFNFAQGAIVVVGTYTTYALLGEAGLSGLAVLGLNTVIGLLLGVLCELVCVRPLRRGRHVLTQHTELLTTIGLSTVLVGLIGVIWGYLPRAVPFSGPTAPVHFLGIVAEPAQIALLGGAVASAVGLHLWFRTTRWGQTCLAAAEDREAAALRGVDVNRLSLLGFAAAGAFGTVSAMAIGPITYALPTLGITLALGGFVAMAIGGHGNFLGCLAGGLLVGTASSLATRYLGAAYDDLVVLALLLASLSLRPAGLGLGPAPRRV